MWAQPVYETIESNVKAYVIKRQMRSAGLAPAKEEAKLDAKVAEPHKPSPFDVGHRPGSVTHQHQAEEVHHLPPVTETVDMERGLSGASSGRSGRLSRRSTARTSGSMAILNSAPIPDLLPVGGEFVVAPDLHALPLSHMAVSLSCNRWQRTCLHLPAAVQGGSGGPAAPAPMPPWPPWTSRRTAPRGHTPTSTATASATTWRACLWSWAARQCA